MVWLLTTSRHPLLASLCCTRYEVTATPPASSGADHVSVIRPPVDDTSAGLSGADGCVGDGVLKASAGETPPYPATALEASAVA